MHVHTSLPSVVIEMSKYLRLLKYCENFALLVACNVQYYSCFTYIRSIT